jgi:hypothetical protein
MSQSYDFELQRLRCKIYNATRSIVRFENKFFYLLWKNVVAYYKAGTVVVN